MKIRVQFLENVARDLWACQRLVDLYDGDVVISRLRILYWVPGFQETSLVVVGQEANYHERLFLEAWYSIKDPQSGSTSRNVLHETSKKLVSVKLLFTLQPSAH